MPSLLSAHRPDVIQCDLTSFGYLCLIRVSCHKELRVMKETIGKLRPLPYPLWAPTVSPHRMPPPQTTTTQPVQQKRGCNLQTPTIVVTPIFLSRRAVARHCPKNYFELYLMHSNCHDVSKLHRGQLRKFRLYLCILIGHSRC